MLLHPEDMACVALKVPVLRRYPSSGERCAIGSALAAGPSDRSEADRVVDQRGGKKNSGLSQMCRGTISNSVSYGLIREEEQPLFITANASGRQSTGVAQEAFHRRSFRC